MCSTPVPDLVFRGDRIYIITACGHSKEEISCGGLDSVGTMLRIAARWGEHPDPRVRHWLHISYISSACVIRS